MKKGIPILLLFFVCNVLHAQLTVSPSGGNKKSVVGERIGITDVTIHYDRPGVKGRDGKIWGDLVLPGFNDLGFGNTKQAPWRAGSNENTTIEFSTDVKIEGRNLAAGKYGFFIAYDPNESTLIFSKNATSWGSYFYDPKEDALRVKVKPQPMSSNVEWLKYEFLGETANSATITLMWEKLMIPFKVEVDLNATQIESFRKELRTEKGFLWETWDQAAQWCLQNNTNLTQALAWSDTATSQTFGGDRTFTTWSTKAQLLTKLGRAAEADAIMKNALPFGAEFELHQYGKDLLLDKRVNDAYTVFKMNYDKHPGTFSTNMGMARVNSAMGKYEEALKFAEAALKIAPSPANKNAVEVMIEKLKSKKDIN